MYRFGQVAAAIGMGEPALRNWLRRNMIDLFEAQPERGWRTFTLNDVYVLAIAAELVRHGAPVKAAVEAVRNGLDMDFATMAGMPNHLWAAESRYGGWEANANEGLVAGLSTSPTMVRVAVPMVLNNARKRLG